MRLRTVCALAGWLCLCQTLSAQPVVLNYQGRLSINDSNFTGSAQFVFSLHDASGKLLWATGDLPQTGLTNMPAGARPLTVRDGIYSIRLGDTSASMPALDAAGIQSATSPFLRVWFNDGLHGWQPTSGDTPLAMAPDKQSISRAEADAIRRELREVRAMLQSQPGRAREAQEAPEPPRTLTLVIGDGPSLGDANAPVVLVEFSDFECTFCKQAHLEIFPELKRQYVDTGKMRIVYRNMPANSHPHANAAAVAALCAHEQRQFWPMCDCLFTNNLPLTRTNLVKYADQLKLDPVTFSACLDNPAIAAQVVKDREFAKAARIPGTPAFVVGRPDGNLMNGTVWVGVQPLSVFTEEIERLLKVATPHP